MQILNQGRLAPVEHPSNGAAFQHAHVQAPALLPVVVAATSCPSGANRELPTIAMVPDIASLDPTTAAQLMAVEVGRTHPQLPSSTRKVRC